MTPQRLRRFAVNKKWVMQIFGVWNTPKICMTHFLFTVSREAALIITPKICMTHFLFTVSREAALIIRVAQLPFDIAAI
jgi:hypothetical protein